MSLTSLGNAFHRFDQADAYKHRARLTTYRKETKKTQLVFRMEGKQTVGRPPRLTEILRNTTQSK